MFDRNARESALGITVESQVKMRKWRVWLATLLLSRAAKYRMRIKGSGAWGRWEDMGFVVTPDDSTRQGDE